MTKTTLATLLGLATILSPVKAENPTVSGDLAYFASNRTKSEYAETNYSATLTDNIRLSGAMDFYKSNQGYFGKTSVDTKLSNGLSFRVQGVHGNAPLTQLGVGVGYVLPTPEKTFAVVRGMPTFVDTSGKEVDNKKIVGYYVSATLPKDCSLWSFGEINLDGAKGQQWVYGEVELAKKFGNRTIGANFQMNGDGDLTPDFVPRIALRAKW